MGERSEEILEGIFSMEEEREILNEGKSGEISDKKNFFKEVGLEEGVKDFQTKS